MSNPAVRLAALFEQFDVGPGRQPVDVRTRVLCPDDETSEIAVWRAHGRVVALTMEVDSVLMGLSATGAKVDPFLRALPRWYRAAMAFDTPWVGATSEPRAALAESDLEALRMLGTTLELTQVAPDQPISHLGEIAKALAAAKAAIVEATEVPEPTRRYLLGLVVEAEDCLVEYEAFGSTPLRRATFTLGGAMQSVVQMGIISDAKVESRWKAALQDVLVQLVAGMGLLLGRTAMQQVAGGVDDVQAPGSHGNPGQTV